MGLYEDIRAEGEAQEKLAKAGSVMARPTMPEWRKRSPLLDTLLTLVDAAVQFGPQPTDAGGAGKIAQMVPGGRVFHGTPFAYKNVDLSKASTATGPSHFVTSAPELASEYAKGLFMDSAAKAGREIAPNVRPYNMQSHNSLVANAPLGDDLAAALEAIQRTYNPAAKIGKHGTVGPEIQRSNLMNELSNSLTPQSKGQELRDILGARLGLRGSENMLQNAGFKSIQYTGEEAGSVPQQATKVLDLSILQSLFE